MIRAAMNNKNRLNPPHVNRQRGAVLLVGLIMVLLISIISISSIRGSNLQEAMAGNMRDQNVAFQAAESALRVGEALISDQVERPAITNNSGFYNDTYTDPATSVLKFTNADWIDPQRVRVAAIALSKVARQPSFVIEQLEPDIGAGAAMEGSAVDIQGMQSTGDLTPHRVTARGFGQDEQSIKTLQTAYNRRYFQ